MAAMALGASANLLYRNVTPSKHWDMGDVQAVKPPRHAMCIKT